ncbi:MAG TPA: acetoacetate decarboxylase family protein [Burkholderiales bacterium]|nr:acetoacetate decarboxylase family protein [Burkholderiales bacterium]
MQRLTRVGRALIAGGLDFTTRSLEITSRHVVGAARAVVDPSRRIGFASCSWLDAYRGYIIELLGAAAAAAQRAYRAGRSEDAEQLLAYAAADEQNPFGLLPLEALAEPYRNARAGAAYLSPGLFQTMEHAASSAGLDGARGSTNLGRAFEPMSSALYAQLSRCFAACGVELSSSVSLVGDHHGWSLRDHQSGRTFNIVRNTKHFEFYGEAAGRIYYVEGAPTSMHTREAAQSELPRVSPHQPLLSRLVLPTRVRDASQAFAFYAVPIDMIQGELDKHKRLGLRAWALDGRRAVLAIFVVDYRDSDLGCYRELGVACLAAPEHEPLAAGLYTLFLGVDDAFSCAAGRSIWGYPKTIHRIEITYGPASMRCKLWNDRAAALQETPSMSIELPNGGSLESRSIPCYTYARKNGLLHRVVVTRTGVGESWHRDAQSVKLRLSPHAGNSPVNKLLLSLGLKCDASDNLLAASWTQKMTAELDVPTPIPSRYGEA